MTTETQFVATLVAHPQAANLGEAVLLRARQALPGAAQPQTLAQGIAADIVFTPEDDATPRFFADILLDILANDGVDAIVQPLAGRRKQLFLADMDSTMIGQECIDELADFVGLKDKVSAITERAMRGELAFEPALRERVALLAGLNIGVVDEIVRDKLTLTPGGTTLVRTMRANGAYTCLVSGGFTLFTQRIAAIVGFNENRANTLIVADETLTGKVDEPILGREAKLATLHELRQAHGLAPETTLAVGDGANDLAMLGEAGLGVAYRAKPAVAAAAHARIDHADLTALLYAQGYRQDEFVTE